MTPNQLPPLPAIDPVLGHPEHHMKWTRPELAWIQQYATDYALTALAQQAQEPVAWMWRKKDSGTRGVYFEEPASFGLLGSPEYEWTMLYTAPQPQPAQQVPEKCLTCSGHGLIGGHMPDGSGHGEPCPDCNAPTVPAPVDERAEFEASMREKHGWVARDFQSDSFGYFDGHTATAWLAWQARAILALRPQQSGLTGCNCRWDGDTQVQWCELHLAHKEAIHEWAERAKEAEKQLTQRPKAQTEREAFATARAFALATITSEEFVRCNGLPTGEPDEFMMTGPDLTDEHANACVEHLKHVGECVAFDCDDGVIVRLGDFTLGSLS